MRVYVYRNLHRGGYSVRYRNKVIAHVSSIILLDVKFLVGKAGNERVRKERQKNVHAGCSGIWVPESSLIGNIISIRYNPYKYTSFVRGIDETEIKKAKIARIDSSGICAVE